MLFIFVFTSASVRLNDIHPFFIVAYVACLFCFSLLYIFSVWVIFVLDDIILSIIHWSYFSTDGQVSHVVPVCTIEMIFLLLIIRLCSLLLSGTFFSRWSHYIRSQICIAIILHACIFQQIFNLNNILHLFKLKLTRFQPLSFSQSC